MNNKGKIEQFLKDLENVINQISEFEICFKILNFMQELKEIPQNLIWDAIAFALSERYFEEDLNREPNWETYFGPLVRWFTEGGKIIEYPNIQQITPETICYWEKRVQESKHPVFKARYSNLVWDFSEKITGKKPHFSIAQIFIDSVIEIAENNLQDHVFIIKKLERAQSLALIINDKDRIEKLIDTIIKYEDTIANDDKLSSWGFSYELLVKNKKIKLEKNKEQKIVKELEERFERLLTNDDPYPAKVAAFLLIDYYNRHKNISKIKSILLKLTAKIQERADKVSPLIASVWLEELYHLYFQYGFKNEADKILTKIKELGKKRHSEFKEIEIPIEIPKDEVERFINGLIEGDLKTALTNVTLFYIPKKDEIIKQLKDLLQKAPLFSSIPHKILDKNGRLIATIGPLKEDIDGRIVLQISQNMGISSSLLHETLKALIKKFNLNTETIINYFYESYIYDEKRKKFFVQGIEAYLRNNYLTALHILIPQIEALIRNLAEKNGLQILKPSRSGGFNYKTLDELLREEAINDILSEDICLYFRVLFTDPRGWNLRNNICHGITQIEHFNSITADRVFHAVLCLALIKNKTCNNY
jgi:hypothetical protein